jgi:hypothetical protein
MERSKLEASRTKASAHKKKIPGKKNCDEIVKAEAIKHGRYLPVR